MIKKKYFSREELIELIEKWMNVWNEHDLDAVIDVFHENAEFRAWTGAILKGKGAIKYAWKPWFDNHGDFNFKIEHLVVDESQQSAAMTWILNWTSPEPGFKGKKETRLGVDYLYFRAGKLFKKHSYCQTVVTIDQHPVKLQAL